MRKPRQEGSSSSDPEAEASGTARGLSRKSTREAPSNLVGGQKIRCAIYTRKSSEEGLERRRRREMDEGELHKIGENRPHNDVGPDDPDKRPGKGRHQNAEGAHHNGHDLCGHDRQEQLRQRQRRSASAFWRSGRCAS